MINLIATLTGRAGKLGSREAGRPRSCKTRFAASRCRAGCPARHRVATVGGGGASTLPGATPADGTRRTRN